MKFSVSANRSKFDKQIQITVSRSVVVTNCRTKCKQFLKALRATQLGDGIFLILESINHGHLRIDSSRSKSG